ncbi:rhsA element core protein RshA [Escherichia coli]|nr:polymorphic toxin type 34 domain-containing protein [Escherichia coli]STJ04989.1 rhsA element core protein RshA [Escherichia coli]
MTSLKTSIKTITYLSDIGCLEIQGASLLILNNPGLALDITMIASRGNVADTGITDRVNDIINDRFWSDGKKPDRCDVLQELIDCGDISAKDAKSTQKAWNCRHSRQSNDKKR